MSNRPSLYTSAVHLKRALRSGHEIPVTPFPPSSLEFIDPKFTIAGNGWGTLLETDDGDLICPLINCGQPFRELSKHIAQAHREIGVSRFRKLMGLPNNVSLLSERVRTAHRERPFRAGIAAILMAGRKTGRRDPAVHRKRAKTRSANARTIGYRNLINACPAQVEGKISLLKSELGRTPSAREFADRFGQGAMGALVRHFGTWNAALTQAGIPLNKRAKISKQEYLEMALSSLSAWVDAHGDLPTRSDIVRRRHAPALPPLHVYRGAFGTDSFDFAMEQAAAILGIEGGRYGLPPRQRSA